MVSDVPNTTFYGSADEVARWIRRIAARDPQALQKLVEATAPRLQAIIVRMVRSPEDMESILAEVYSQVWKTADRYHEHLGSGMGWLSVITRSRSIDHLRRTQSRPDMDQDSGTLETLPSELPDPAASAELSERASAVRQALSHLPLDQRRAIAAAFFEGLSHGQISLALGQPLGTVKTKIRMAMSALRHSLQNQGEELTS